MASSSQVDERPCVVIATLNRHKLTELKSALNQLQIHFVPLNNWNLKPVIENGTTFVENAILKARHASKHTGLPAVADDSGLVVDLLDGEPGIRSSRFAGERASDEENNTLLLDRVRAKRNFNEPVTASFVAILVYLEHAQDSMPIVAEGRWRGSIVSEPRGKHGFGYDPLFLPTNLSQTAAELGPSIKSRESHRARAARKLVHKLLDRRANRPSATRELIEPTSQKFDTLT